MLNFQTCELYMYVFKFDIKLMSKQVLNILMSYKSKKRCLRAFAHATATCVKLN